MLLYHLSPCFPRSFKCKKAASSRSSTSRVFPAPLNCRTAQAPLPSVALPLCHGAELGQTPAFVSQERLCREVPPCRPQAPAPAPQLLPGSVPAPGPPSPRAAPAARSRPALLRGRPPSGLFPAHAASPFSAHFPPRCGHSDSRPPPLSPQPSPAAAAAGNRTRRFQAAPGHRRTVPTGATGAGG